MGAEQQAAIVRAFDAVDVRIRDQVVAAVLGVFDRLGSWRDADIERFTAVVVPVILGAQRQMASLTDAYIAAVLSDMLGATVRPVGGEPPVGSVVRGGTEPAEVYARPIRTVWRTLADGQDVPAALKAGRLRLWQLTTTDLQLAKTHAAARSMAADGRVAGYRRVLKGSRSCGLCVVASTQRYHKARLMPIHPGCDCGVVPIVGGTDPGHVLNESRLENVHDAIQQRFGVSDRSARVPDYRDVLVTHEHGELGPVLARKGDAFTGPDDLH